MQTDRTGLLMLTEAWLVLKGTKTEVLVTCGIHGLCPYCWCVRVYVYTFMSELLFLLVYLLEALEVTL